MQGNQIFGEIDMLFSVNSNNIYLASVLQAQVWLCGYKDFLKETFFFIAYNKMDIAAVEKHLQWNVINATV